MKSWVQMSVAVVCTLLASHAPGGEFTAIPVGRADYQIWREGTHLFTIETRVIGPDWAGGQLSAMSQSKDGRRVLNGKATFRGRGAAPGTQGLEFDFH
jgi:hypothetical protein